jgi:hypothetical protein
MAWKDAMINRRDFLASMSSLLASLSILGKDQQQPPSSADDLIYRTTREFHDSLGTEKAAAVKTDPATIFRASGFEPDPAQLELMECRDKNILVLWTRQFAGKSQTVAAISLYEAMTNLGKQGQGSTTLMLSAGQREATELLRKVRHLRYGLIHQHVPAASSSWRPRSVAKDVKRWRELTDGSRWDEPKLPPEVNAVVDAQTMIELENGSRIISLPSKSQAIVGYTADLLILDEAKVIPDDVYRSVRPMLATTGGRMIAPSTPLGQRGWFYEACKQCEDARLRGEQEPYKFFKRTCWDCPRLDRQFIEQERKMIGDYWFRQEYEVEFLSKEGAVFRPEDIDRMLQSKEEPYQLPW